ncbi:ARM repeat-containing protein [Aureobasidium pullulans]|nr:ARM repeat-containing protein [Aureobasidium pullulans]
MSSSFSSQPRPVTMSGFSQPFRPPTSESRNPAPGTSSASSNNLTKWQNTSNIWSTSFNPQPPTSRQTTAPRTSLNFGAQNGKLSGKDTIEGRSGSGQLVDSSISDDYNTFRSGTFAKRDDATRLGGPLPKPSDTNFAQHRSNSNSGLPQAYAGAPRGSASFSSSRPTTSGINSAVSAAPKTQFSGTFDSPLSYTNEAPPVFTKFDRPSKPATSRPVDSAYGDWLAEGNSLTHSPVDERRRPSATGYFHGLPSAPPSRNNSLPPSRHSDVQPVYPNPAKPDHFSSSQPPTNSFRVNSFSAASRPSGSFGAADAQANSLAQLSQMTLHDDSHNFATSRPSFSMPSFLNQSPSSYTRNSSTDQYDDAEEISRVPPTFPSDAYSPAAQTPFEHPAYRMSQYPERSLLNGNMYNPRNANPNAPAFVNQRYPQQSVQDVDHRYLLNLPYGPVSGGFYSYQLPHGSAIHSIPAAYPPMHSQMSIGGVPSMPAPRGPREETGHSLRSALLEDFKTNNKTRRYELKVGPQRTIWILPFANQLQDIFDHVVEFSGDQHGSRFIQQKLETANSDEKERLFREIGPNALQLMTDVFGNYVIQKFFEHGDQNQKKILANKMKGRVLDLSLQMYGCRVVQKALEHILNDQQASLVRELEKDILRCVKDQNGNHVIQKAIERCDAKDISFIFQAFTGQIQHLSVHTYGCRVIQRCLENCEDVTRKAILAELHDCMPTLIGDSFGNYVAQHVVEFGFDPDRQRVLELVIKGLEGYSKHKFASNVVEKCLVFSANPWKTDVIGVIVRNNNREGETMLLGLIRDNYGNYVIQKLLDLLSQPDLDHFIEILQPELAKAKRTGCGKQVTAIEKRMQRPYEQNLHAHQSAFGSRTISQNTTPPPPPLTADQRSLQNSSVGSVNGDALEGAASSRKGSVEHAVPTVFEP